MRVSGDIVEGLALVAIGLAATFAARPLFAELRLFEPAALVPLGLGVLGVCVSLRRVMSATQTPRVAVSVRASYLTALLLTILAVLVPARWSIGAAIAMIDIAIVFDLLTRITSQRST